MGVLVPLVIASLCLDFCSSFWFQSYTGPRLSNINFNKYNPTPRTTNKNVCKDIWDYDTIDKNENCSYNPDVDSSVTQIIQRYGYPAETHQVVTADGFYLQLFRIPYGKNNGSASISNRQPVFLQHGIFSSSASWVIVANRSLAFILADEGYDVWLGNARGSTYSNGHAMYSQTSKQYWDWSYPEIATYDIPAALDMVIAKNGRNDVIYIGQSLGTNYPYVYGSENPEEAKNKIALIVNLAPTIFLGEMKTDFIFWAPYEKQLKEMASNNGLYEVLAQRPEFRKFWENVCFQSSRQHINCIKLIFSVFGPDFKQLIPGALPLVLGHFPGGSSMKNLMHLAQSINTNKFRPFSHGKLKNLEIYGSEYPPSYNLSKMLIPSLLMYAENDYVATDTAACKLYEQLPNNTRVGLFKIKNRKFNHVDFIFSKDVKEEVFDEMLRVMKKYK